MSGRKKADPLPPPTPTQGEWAVYGASHAVGETFGVKAGGKWIAKCHPFDGKAAGLEEARANASLIAAAPDLYEACIQARGALRLDVMRDDDGKPFGTTTVALEALHAAIAKAVTP